jgi:antitoxin (DNA-binding transcriptional repressor) of toxin-antitoxin stability system
MIYPAFLLYLSSGSVRTVEDEQDTPFVLLKNGKPVARLVPESERVCTGRDLAEAMDKADLSAEGARAWHKGLAVARPRLAAPMD